MKFGFLISSMNTSLTTGFHSSGSSPSFDTGHQGNYGGSYGGGYQSDSWEDVKSQKEAFFNKKQNENSTRPELVIKSLKALTEP